uniref:Uncharacterized protein n=1 Tax=Pyxicephalus adspersus TaxID=30357 RepID=A0AAV3AV37_PYXAD|nr:TPA: hypothetical protein GDO54_000605 [Pyxicephalus adspersus]
MGGSLCSDQCVMVLAARTLLPPSSSSATGNYILCMLSSGKYGIWDVFEHVLAGVSAGINPAVFLGLVSQQRPKINNFQYCLPKVKISCSLTF